MNKTISVFVLASYLFTSTAVFSVGTGENPAWKPGDQVKTNVSDNGTASIQLKEDACPFFGVVTSDDKVDKNLSTIQNSVLAAYTDDQNCGEIKDAVNNMNTAVNGANPGGSSTTMPTGGTDPNAGASNPSTGATSPSGGMSPQGGGSQGGGTSVTCNQNYQQNFADEYADAMYRINNQVKLEMSSDYSQCFVPPAAPGASGTYNTVCLQTVLKEKTAKMRRTCSLEAAKASTQKKIQDAKDHEAKKQADQAQVTDESTKSVNNVNDALKKLENLLKNSSKCTDESFKIAAASAGLSAAGNVAGNFGPYGMAAKAGLDFVNTLMNVIKSAVIKSKTDKLNLDKNFPGIACAYFYAQKAKTETGLCETLNSKATEGSLKDARDQLQKAAGVCQNEITVKELDPGIKDLLSALKDVDKTQNDKAFKEAPDKMLNDNSLYDSKNPAKNKLTLPDASVADQAEQFRAALNKLDTVFKFKDAAAKVNSGTYDEGAAGAIQKKDALEFQSILSQADKNLKTINGVYSSVVTSQFSSDEPKTRGAGLTTTTYDPKTAYKSLRQITQDLESKFSKYKKDGTSTPGWVQFYYDHVNPADSHAKMFRELAELESEKQKNKTSAEALDVSLTKFMDTNTGARQSDVQTIMESMQDLYRDKTNIFEKKLKNDIAQVVNLKKDSNTGVISGELKQVLDICMDTASVFDTSFKKNKVKARDGSSLCAKFLSCYDGPKEKDPYNAYQCGLSNNKDKHKAKLIAEIQTSETVCGQSLGSLLK